MPRPSAIPRPRPPRDRGRSGEQSRCLTSRSIMMVARATGLLQRGEVMLPPVGVEEPREAGEAELDPGHALRAHREGDGGGGEAPGADQEPAGGGMPAGGEQGCVVECRDAHHGGARQTVRMLEIVSDLNAGSRQRPRQVAEIDQSQSEATAIRESEKVSGRFDRLGGYAGSSRQGREPSLRLGATGYQ